MSTLLSDRLDALRDRLQQHPEVVVAYLFGSAATQARPPRDVDVAVVFADAVDAFRAVLGLQLDLEASTGVPMDVHDLDALPVDLQFRIIDEGHPVLVRDEDARIRREVRIMRAYYDFTPYLERIRNGAHARLASGSSRD